ncbi:hypothetical protein OC834_003179 [Tilletia horrida]|nr:hypothetical protein OC834_003179 [Tilletia horrida]
MRLIHPLPARPSASVTDAAAAAGSSLPPHPSSHNHPGGGQGQGQGQGHGQRGRGRARGRGHGQGHGFGQPPFSSHRGRDHGSGEPQQGRGAGREQHGPRRDERGGHHEQRNATSSSARTTTATAATDGPPDATIQGLNIRLDHPLLIEHWIAERKKRWPTRAVIEQKERDAVWRLPGSSSGSQSRKRKRTEVEQQQQGGNADAGNDQGKGKGKAREQDAGKASSSGDSATSDSDSSSSEDEDEEGSDAEAKDENPADDKEEADAEDLDGPADGDPVKVEGNNDAREARTPALPARKADEKSTTQTPARSQPSQPPRKVRPRPRGPPANPFARPSSSLLHALLRREIASHTNAVLQFFRFLVLNGFLIGVERKRGDAEEALRRARLIIEEPGSSKAEEARQLGTDAAEVSKPGKTKTNIELRPLSSLAFPPAPDPLTFLDPLRALDPFPLTHEQLIASCEDDAIRDALAKCSAPQSELAGADGKQRESGLTTAIRTLDALPTEQHRTAALELILHVVPGGAGPGQPAINPHLGAVWQPPPSSSSSSGPQQKPISETELFRLGLRVGFAEQDDIRLIAERISAVLAQVPVHAALPEELQRAVGLARDDNNAEAVEGGGEAEAARRQNSGIGRGGSASTSAAAAVAKIAPTAMGAGVYEARGVGWQQLEWEREWEQRETLKRLGLRLD